MSLRYTFAASLTLVRVSTVSQQRLKAMVVVSFTFAQTNLIFLATIAAATVLVAAAIAVAVAVATLVAANTATATQSSLHRPRLEPSPRSPLPATTPL